MNEAKNLADLNFRLTNLQTDKGPALGAETKGGIINITETGPKLGLSVPQDMDDLLQNDLGFQVQAVMDRIEGDKTDAVIIPLEKVVFAPLVTRPEKIICIGFNYREHAKETGTELPKAPPIFSKYRNALNHHGGTIALPVKLDDQFDFETELVIVIGKKCHGISENDALNCVAGYATGHDFSARQLQQATSQFGAGKMSDGFAPIGPWLVPACNVKNPNDLKLKTWVNGTLRQDWNTNDMIFDCKKLISYCAGIMTLKPGDLIFTGTPQGVILGEKIPAEDRRWLRAGDSITSSLEGLGELNFQLV